MSLQKLSEEQIRVKDTEVQTEIPADAFEEATKDMEVIDDN